MKQSLVFRASVPKSFSIWRLLVKGDELSSWFIPKENKFSIGTLDWIKCRASADSLSFTTHDLHDSNHSLLASVARVGSKIFLLRHKRLGKRKKFLALSVPGILVQPHLNI